MTEETEGPCSNLDYRVGSTVLFVASLNVKGKNYGILMFFS